jgi:hypothetical protein
LNAINRNNQADKSNQSAKGNYKSGNMKATGYSQVLLSVIIDETKNKLSEVVRAHSLSDKGTNSNFIIEKFADSLKSLFNETNLPIERLMN